ncbi:MAG: ZIP family metal transporter [Burkholderiales bacterium]|jgi:ZIP family zinc transporter|nr:ZIP family metal transporter [Burkholderiales bacterium]
MLQSLSAAVATSPFGAALLAGVIGGAGATFVGALPVLAIRWLPARLGNLMLAFAAGVMLAASTFSLLLPALDRTIAMPLGKPQAALAVLAALAAGAGVMWAIQAFAPHQHFVKGREGGRAEVERIWLFVIAVAIHNLPEGLAIGVGTASGDLRIGLGATLGIGLQNLPEGLAVAFALVAEGYSRRAALGAAALTGMVEVVGAAIGAAAVTLADALLPGALAFAAGAMLFVISDEIIPETHRRGQRGLVTAALLAGFALMFFLDTALVH